MPQKETASIQIQSSLWHKDIIHPAWTLRCGIFRWIKFAKFDMVEDNVQKTSFMSRKWLCEGTRPTVSDMHGTCSIDVFLTHPALRRLAKSGAKIRILMKSEE